MDNYNKAGRLRLVVMIVLFLPFSLIPQTDVLAINYYVTTTADSGAGSLRQAILDANSNPGEDHVVFSLNSSTDPNYDSSTGVFTITLSSPLLLDDIATYVDGDTQYNSNPDGLEIQVRGQTGVSTVFSITGDNNVISNLCITNAVYGISIISGAAGNGLFSNAIGMDCDMTSISPNTWGVVISGNADGNMINANHIGGNTADGILISDSNGNQVLSNTIGTNSNGTDLGNDAAGIKIIGSSIGNIIGDSFLTANLISRNGTHGIWIDGASGNSIKYNYIGTDQTGMFDLGNAQNGIYVTGGAVSTEIQRNLISGNDQHGIYLSGGGIADTVIASNLIGSDFSGNSPIGNGWHGVAVYNGPIRTNITQNAIVANGWSGLVLLDSMSNTSSYNRIGVTQSSSSVTLGNAYFGIHILGGFNTVFNDTIAHNGLANPANGDGIRVDGATYAASYNMMRNLFIYENGGKGIENINGGNDNLAGPSLDIDASCKHISGSVPVAEGYIDIYSGPDDEGKTFMVTLVPDASGNFEFDGDFPGPYISATWTDGYPKTSEFSAVFACVRNYVPIIMKP